MKTPNESISIWYEEGGLKKMKIDAIFTVFKLVSIFGVSSIPFWLQFHKDHYDISNVTFSLDGGWAWGYYLITYSIMSYFIAQPLFQKIDDVLENEEFFRRAALNIDSTETTSVNQILDSIEVEKEEFLLEALKEDHFLLALDDSEFINITSPVFKSLLSTRPFEIALRQIIKYYYLNNNFWTFRNSNENAEAFTKLSKKMGWIIIPFIPSLLIFSTVNHIITYVSNRDFLSMYDYNRFGIWKFRYYCEFLVDTKKRLAKTRDAAKSVVMDMFLESWKSSISKCISFVFSLFSLFLLIFSFKGYERLWGADIIPLIAIFTAISAALFPQKKGVEGRMSILKSIIKPDITRKEIEIYFESKISILLKEILSILLLPIVFFWVLPNKAYWIAHFMQSHNKNGICTFAAWRFKDTTIKTKRSYEYISQAESIIDI